MIYILYWFGILAAVFLWLEFAPLVYFGEGWLVPHRERQENCRVKCATCRRPT